MLAGGPLSVHEVMLRQLSSDVVLFVHKAEPPTNAGEVYPTVDPAGATARAVEDTARAVEKFRRGVRNTFSGRAQCSVDTYVGEIAVCLG